MTDIHSCSYFCNKPECIKAQRDELRERLAQPEQKADAHLLYSPGDVLICKESGERAKVINGNTGHMQLANNKISLEWSDEVYGEYTLEQIMDGFIRERLAQPEQKPVASIGSLNEFTAMELVRRGFALTDPLYTAPPQRKPLTDEDIESSYAYEITKDKECFRAGVLWAQSQLKENT